MQIGGLGKSSFVDYPGQVAAVIFTRGCNMRCPYCHNASLVDGTAPHLDQEEVRAFLNDRFGRLKAVVLSGGEPTLQKDLKQFIIDIREMGYLVKLDTNGSRPFVVDELMKEGLLDYVALDLKAGLGRYQEACGIDGLDEAVAATIRLLRAGNVAYEFRSTLCDGIHDEAHMQELATIPQAQETWVLQPFKACDEVLLPQAQLQTPVKEQLQKVVDAAGKRGVHCRIRG